MLLYVFLYGVDDHRNLHVLTLSSPTRRSSDLLAERGSSLVITVDCGAMAVEALEQARKAGLDVIVVDHHKCAAENPPAVALVNPNRPDAGDVAATHGPLAAVGVAFLLAVALVRLLRNRSYFASRPRSGVGRVGRVCVMPCRFWCSPFS